jgi:hypothetical protein
VGLQIDMGAFVDQRWAVSLDAPNINLWLLTVLVGA